MTFHIGDLVEFWAPAAADADRRVPISGRGLVRCLHQSGDPSFITITLAEDTRRMYYAGRPPYRRPRTLRLPRSHVRRIIGQFRPGDTPKRYGPYVPIAKALP